jgi:hypothetical protein
MESVEKYLLPYGYRKKSSGSNFYRILDDGMYMECLNFQKSQFAHDSHFETRFTVNVTYGQGNKK